MPHTARPPLRRLLVLTALALLTLPALAACGSGDARPRASAQESAEDPDRVTIRLLAFRPDAIRVAAGTRITWAQEDPGAHTVTAGVVEQQPGGVEARPDGRFDSGEIAEGETFSLALEEAGTYPYFCSIHPSTMRGEIQVF